MIKSLLRKAILGALLVAAMGYLTQHGKEKFEQLSDMNPPGDEEVHSPTRQILLSEERAQHILYGDETGGGHKYGVGAPCKSEFPPEWDDERILSITKMIAANDNLPWKRESNGYYVSNQLVGKYNVRVVLGPQKREIITSYPLNGPRNPCPAKRPANDNYNR